MHDFDWFLERVEVARWADERPGYRDVMTSCPVCSSRDNLHITEKNGKALTKCFGCNAPYADLVAALEETPEATEEVPAVVVRRTRRTPREVTTPVEQVSDPLEWYAKYCDVGVEELKALGVEATPDGWVRHTWPFAAVAKDRRPNSGDRRWVPKGANPPKLWPQIPELLPNEIWLCEGETDAITLRLHYNLEAYTSGSATNLLTVDDMRALRRRGVEHIVVAYDNDKDGVRATKTVVETAREAGLGASVAHLGDPFMGGPKDWRERWASGETEPPTPGFTQDLEYDYVPLVDVPSAPATQLLLEKLHPTAHTILFGDGGTGKGVIASLWAAQLVDRYSMRVLVVDYEQNAAHEWRPRIEAFGGAIALKSVYINQPTDPLWDAAGGLRQAIIDLKIDLVIIDSITYACVGQDVEKSATAALYSRAIAQLKVPVLSLAHTTKTDPNPQHPFGSVYWSNGARITIAVSAKDYDGPRQVICKKTNQVAPFKPFEYDWSWVESGLSHFITKEQPTKIDLFDPVHALLTEGDKTLPELTDALTAQSFPLPAGALMRTLSRPEFVKPSKRGGKYSLAVALSGNRSFGPKE